MNLNVSTSFPTQFSLKSSKSFEKSGSDPSPNVLLKHIQQENLNFEHRDFNSPKIVKASHDLVGEAPVVTHNKSKRHTSKVVILKNRPVPCNILLDSPQTPSCK